MDHYRLYQGGGYLLFGAKFNINKKNQMNYLTTLIASVALLFNTGIHSDAESTFESTDTYSSYYPTWYLAYKHEEYM